MTVLAATTSADNGPAVFDTSLQLGAGEPLAVGVKRVTMQQLEHAASGYVDGEVPFGSAVHECRKSIKRIRAMLRLIQGELSKQVFTFENQSLRRTANMLGEIRSAQGVLNAAVSVQGLYAEFLAEGTFGDMVSRLGRRRDLVELQALEDPNLVGRVIRDLERAHHRYNAWPTDPEAVEAYGMGIRDDFDAIGDGLSNTYQKGRRRMVTAYRRGEHGDFHDWRKRVKDLRHQFEFLAPLWPEVVVGMAMTLERLGSVLGEDNDLAELDELLRARSDLCPNARERSLFRALVRQRRGELQVAAEILGRRIYAESPKSLTSRFGEYWGARHMAITGALDTIVVY